MKKNKGDIISIIFAIILLLMVLTLALVATFQRQRTEENTPLAIPTQIPHQTQTRQVTPEVSPIGQEPLVSYSQKDQDKLMERIIHRQPLSNNDAFAKANILSILPYGQPSGILYQSSNITIDYTDSADMFQVEITTPDINIAKAEANVWFRARGMTQKGICDLPLMFYIDYETMIKLKNSGTTFSPLANSC